MKLNFNVYESFSDLPFDWSLQQMDENICVGIDAVENAKIADLKNLYVVAYNNNEAVYAAYFQLLSVGTQHFNIEDKKIQQMSLCVALNLVKPTLLVAGNLFRHDVLFYNYLNKSFTKEERAFLYQATVNHLIDYTNASGIFLKDVSPLIAQEILKDETFLQMPEDISMEIEILKDWNSFADYEKALKHKYAQRSRKIRKAFSEIRIVSFEVNEIEKYSKEMEALYLQVTQKQLVSMGQINASFFNELKKILKERYQVFGFFKDEKLIAFSSAILHQEEYDMNYIGIDYAYNQSHSLYFNILFHCLESAITTKSKKLILGRTALEAKAILGCTPEYRYSFYKLRNPVVNWFYQLVSKYFRESQGDMWKERHPFKPAHYAIESAV